MYYFGFGVQANSATAESWYEAGVKLHDPLAEFRLGSLYSGWQGHAEDLHRSLELLRMSSDQGYLPSTHSLAMLLINHPEINNSTNAVELLETSSNAGNWRSSVALGILNREGKFVAKDKKAAYFHFQVATRQGGHEASELVANDVKALKSTLSADAQHEAEVDADAWYAQHHLPLLYIIKKRGKHDRPRDLAVIAAPAGSFAGGLIPIGAS
jgi:TPR repeat protein